MFRNLIFTPIALILILSFTLTASAHPATFPFPEDVNADGIVNIQDLVRVASAFGAVLANVDVNSDGRIDILDLVRVANAFGQTEQIDDSTYHDIQHYIFDKSCVNTACHGTPQNAGGLNLTYANSYQNLVGQTPRNPAVAAGMQLVLELRRNTRSDSNCLGRTEKADQLDG